MRYRTLGSGPDRRREVSALALGVIRHARDRGKANGYTSAELSWILEDNKPIRDIIELVGGRAYKIYRVYEKALA